MYGPYNRNIQMEKNQSAMHQSLLPPTGNVSRKILFNSLCIDLRTCIDFSLTCAYIDSSSRLIQLDSIPRHWRVAFFSHWRSPEKTGLVLSSIPRHDGRRDMPNPSWFIAEYTSAASNVAYHVAVVPCRRAWWGTVYLPRQAWWRGQTD
jgi:hypothetical protein